MARIELTDEQLEAKVAKLLPWSSKRYKNGRRDCHPSMFEDGEIKDWLPRHAVKRIVVLLQHGYSRREAAYRLGIHRKTVEFVAVGKSWHQRCKVEVPEHLKPRSGRKPASNRPDKVKDNQLTFTDEQVTMLINEAKELMLEGSERRVRIKFPAGKHPPVDFPRAFGKQKTTTNSADFWPKWREYTPLSVLTYFSKLGKLDISEEELRLLDAKAKEMKKKLEQL